MAGQRKETRRQGARVVPSLEQGTSRVSQAAGRVGTHSGKHDRVELQSSASSRRRSSARQTPRSKSGAGSYRGSSSSRSASPVRDADPKDTQFIRWASNKWSSAPQHHRQVFLSFLLFVFALALFGSLTFFTKTPVLNGVNRFLLVFFSWTAYPLALGLVAFALALMINGFRKQRFAFWRLVIGLGVIVLLLLLESRLIAGHLAVGVLAEILVTPLLGWPVGVAHIIVLGLLLIAAIITFRITFGHVLLVAHFFQRLITDPDPLHMHHSDDEDDLSQYLGQRPRFSRYSGTITPAPAALEDEKSSPSPPVQTRRRKIADERTVEVDSYNDDDRGVIEFESDFEDEDPDNDINLHKHKVGMVKRGTRTPRPIDLGEHENAVRGARQQALPFEGAVESSPHMVLKTPGMEPLPPNPKRQFGIRTRRATPDQQAVTSLWRLPNTSILHSPDVVKVQMMGEDTAVLARTIQDTLRSFRVEAEVRESDISIGPTVIRFGIRPTGKPAMRVDERTGKAVPLTDASGNIVYEARTRVSRIMALQNDLALVLEAKSIRMEAPVPGRPYVGVEIPNKNSRLVTLREVLESKEYQTAKNKSKLAIALGRDVAGQVRVGDLTKMPHLLIAGATGAGKCLAYDEPVFLANGQVSKVQELIGQTVHVIGVTDTLTMQQTPVPATFTENGVQEVFEIELDNGMILRRTGEHPLWSAHLDENQHIGRQPNGKASRRTRAIDAEWIRAKDLRVCGNRPNFDGHVILCPRILKQQGTAAHNDANVILCAALLAEGGLNRTGRANLLKRSMGTPRFTNADASMIALVDTAAREYGCQLVVSPDKVKGNVDYYISQISHKGRNTINPIAQLVCDWKINCLATQKRIPDWVFLLPNEQIALFLRVFFDCDGWIDAHTDRTSAVNITLANPILIQQIGQLALRLGITGTYRYRENGYAGAWSWTTLMVQEWQERIGSTVKAAKLECAVAEQVRQRKLAATEWNAWRRARPLAEQKFADCPPGYEWRKIVAIRRVTVPTVNIEVHSGNHAFVGYAVEHNSVMINSIIGSFLTQATPDDVRMLMVDPKMVELSMYNGIPHLQAPVVTEVDKVVPLLKRAISEMERRYRLFSQLGVRNLDAYRKMRWEKLAKGDDSLSNLPAIVIIIDELADLMMAAPEEVESMVCRLAQLARATGIHLVIATQRPSVDVITGLIKANIPTRISFMVSSSVDSRTIIDMGGAERLLGRGDMLYLPVDAGRPERIQGAFVADDEAEELTNFWARQAAEFNAATVKDNADAQAANDPEWDLDNDAVDEFGLDDDLLDRAEEVVRDYGRASISLLQRRLKIGYSRAARLIDLLEEQGIIGQSEGSKGREVLDNGRNGSSVVDDIVEEEHERDEFLRRQAARRNSDNE